LCWRRFELGVTVPAAIPDVSPRITKRGGSSLCAGYLRKAPERGNAVPQKARLAAYSGRKSTATSGICGAEFDLSI
jgi:hypothetical protein